MSIDNEQQFTSWKSPTNPDAIIGEGILYPGTVMMLFGAPGTWKTMNVLHLAYSIASGKSWFGFKTMPATVLSHQVELPKALLQKRFIKYRQGNHSSSHNVFFQTPADEVLLDTTFGIGELSKSIEEIRRRAAAPNLPLVIIIDPLMLYMAGHITDEYDIKKFLRNVNSLRRSYDATFIIIHHSRLTRVGADGQVVDLGAEELMGSSYLNNYLDTIIRIKLLNPFTGSDVVHMDFYKVRHAEKFIPGLTVKWHRETLVPEVLSRDEVEDEELTIRGLRE